MPLGLRGWRLITVSRRKGLLFSVNGQMKNTEYNIKPSKRLEAISNLTISADLHGIILLLKNKPETSYNVPKNPL